ncbi:MAG: flagellar hook-associated protein FlgK [Parvibaculaceae bacterium]
MSLTTSLNIARSALNATGGQTAVVSRNIASVNDPNYTRRYANLTTLEGGGVSVSSIGRSTDKVLFDARLDASSQSTMQDSIVAALERLQNTVGDPESETSAAALIGKLNDALQLYATSPNDNAAAASAVARANDVARALNDATSAVQSVRSQADADMASSVGTINSLLSKLEEVNATIVGRSSTNEDISDYLDQRDKIISDLSQEIGIKTQIRGNNDLVVFTDSGVTLFETKARTVTFQATPGYNAATPGNAVYVDGVPVTGDSASMGIRSGRLAGLAAIRDDYAPRYQAQLDEIARGLIQSFAESDQSGGALPDVPGLFTWSGNPAIPGVGAVSGLAGEIRVAASVDPAQGGNAKLLRDGGISGNPAYVYNSTNAAGFTDRLQGLIDSLGASQAFDPSAGLGANATLASFASGSAGWLQEARKSATADATYSTALLNRATESLSNASGVNLDEEMTIMLELERSYQASAKLMSAVNDLFQTLLDSV